MTLAGKMYFEAVGKIGENVAVSPVSRELGECQTSLVWNDLWACPSTQPQGSATRQTGVYFTRFASCQIINGRVASWDAVILDAVGSV